MPNTQQPKGAAESGSDALLCSPSLESPPTPHPSGAWDRTDYVREYDKCVIERDDARRDRDEWKESAEECYRANKSLFDERNKLRNAIRDTIMENLHLADGDVCTLKRLKDAIGFELPPENAWAVAPPPQPSASSETAPGG